MDLSAYHVLELQIACDPADTRRVMPRILSEHRRILDIGCGAGQTLIASRLGAQVTAIGLDLDRKALELGRHIDGRITYVQARGEQLPLASDSFDLVISRVSLPYMNVRGALAEMARVLAPGGTAWFVLHPFSKAVRELGVAVRALDARLALHRLYVLANGALLHCFGRELPSPFSGRRESFQTEARLRRELEALGFEDVQVKCRSFFVVTARKRSARS